jgi:hypothetical protein
VALATSLQAFGSPFFGLSEANMLECTVGVDMRREKSVVDQFTAAEAPLVHAYLRHATGQLTECNGMLLLPYLWGFFLLGVGVAGTYIICGFCENMGRETSVLGGGKIYGTSRRL